MGATVAGDVPSEGVGARASTTRGVPGSGCTEGVGDGATVAARGRAAGGGAAVAVQLAPRVYLQAKIVRVLLEPVQSQCDLRETQNRL